MAESDPLIPTPVRPPVAPPAAEASHPAPITAAAAAHLFAVGRVPSQSAPVAWEPPSIDELQHALPQYEIRALIGRGGMGAVYRGMQRSLHREVAIKILPPEVMGGDPQFAVRFQQEARAMAQLTHPGIVTVHDAGETAEGLLYFVMEYIEGTDVQAMLTERGQLPPEEALPIVARVCEALEFAHESGFIHRDIKPANIMIDRRGQVKVADFGLARTATEAGFGLTGSKFLIGTAEFVAPEAFCPGVELDRRADVYAVGVMLYQMLTGTLPRGRFELPSRCVAGLDERIDAIVDRAMQSNREWRYPTAHELRADIHRILGVAPGPSGLLVAAGHAPSVAPTARARGKGRIWIAVAAIVVLTVGGVMWWVRSVGAAGATARQAKAAAEENRHRWKPVANKFNASIDRGDGWASLSGTNGTRQLDDPEGKPLALRNGGVRAQRRVPQNWHGGILLHVRSQDHGRRLNLCYFEPKASGEKGYLQLREFRPETLPPKPTAEQAWGAQKLLAEQRIPPVGTEFTTELVVVGSTLRGSLGPHAVTCKVEDEGKAGRVAIDEANALAFRNVEVLNLDGLTAAEALKVVGLAADAGAQPASAEPGPLGETAPNARWRDAFAESPLKEVIAKTERTAQGYRLPANNHWAISPRLQRSGAVRVRGTGRGEKFVNLYVAHEDRLVERVRFLSRTGDWLLSHGPLGLKEVDLAATHGASPLDGQPHELLFARVGGRLRTMLDGHLLHDEGDPSSGPGTFVLDLYPEADLFVEKVEYLDLEGVPDAAARDLLSSQKR